MKLSAIACIGCLIVIAMTGVSAEAAQYVSPVDGMSFDYDDKEWVLNESAINNSVVLRRMSKRGEGRIVVGRRATSVHTLHDTRKDITVEREGRRYVVSCAAPERDFLFTLFTCNELVRTIRIDPSYEIDATASLDILPSYRSRSNAVLNAAVYALLSGAQGCADLSTAIQVAARTSSPPLSTRLSVISDLLRGRIKRARSSVIRLVDQYEAPLDLVLLGLASQSRADRERWRTAYAGGRVRGSLIAYWQGMMALKEQRFGDAAMFFERAFQETPSDLAAVRLAEIAMSAGDMKSARHWWKAMDDRSILKAALTIQLAYHDGAYEDALWVYDQFEGTWCGELGAHAATDAARAAYAQGQRARARTLLKQAIVYNESYAPAYKLLAQIAVEEGQGDEELAKVLRRYLPHARLEERAYLLRIIENL